MEIGIDSFATAISDPPTGALLVGGTETVVKKLRYVDGALGGVWRVTFQMGVSTLPHEKMLPPIEILGKSVAPNFRRPFPPGRKRG